MKEQTKFIFITLLIIALSPLAANATDYTKIMECDALGNDDGRRMEVYHESSTGKFHIDVLNREGHKIDGFEVPMAMRTEPGIDLAGNPYDKCMLKVGMSSKMQFEIDVTDGESMRERANGIDISSDNIFGTQYDGHFLAEKGLSMGHDTTRVGGVYYYDDNFLGRGTELDARGFRNSERKRYKESLPVLEGEISSLEDSLKVYDLEIESINELEHTYGAFHPIEDKQIVDRLANLKKERADEQRKLDLAKLNLAKNQTAVRRDKPGRHFKNRVSCTRAASVYSGDQHVVDHATSRFNEVCSSDRVQMAKKEVPVKMLTRKEILGETQMVHAWGVDWKITPAHAVDYDSRSGEN